jgi:membrane protein required for colicin V production
LNWLDIVIVAVLLASLVAGLVRGFVVTLLSLIGMVTGVLVAGYFYGRLAGLLTFISNPNLANIIAFTVLLAAVLIVAGLIGMALRSVLAAVNLGCFDRIAGMFLGLLRGTGVLSALLAGIAKFFGEGMVGDSMLARILLDRFPIVLGLLPSQFDTIRDFFR